MSEDEAINLKEFLCNNLKIQLDKYYVGDGIWRIEAQLIFNPGYENGIIIIDEDHVEIQQ